MSSFFLFGLFRPIVCREIRYLKFLPRLRLEKTERNIPRLPGEREEPGILCTLSDR